MVRFLCPITEMKATVIPLHMLLDLSKNIHFPKSYSRKLFVTKKTQVDFQKIIFKKLFKKSKCLGFRNFEIFNLHRFFQRKYRKSDLLKNHNFGFFEKFFEKYFSEIELSFFGHKKFSVVTFRKIKIFT